MARLRTDIEHVDVSVDDELRRLACRCWHFAAGSMADPAPERRSWVDAIDWRTDPRAALHELAAHEPMIRDLLSRVAPEVLE